MAQRRCDGRYIRIAIALLGSTSMGSGLWLRFSESTKEFFNGGMLMSGSASVAVPIVLGILMFIAVILSCSEKKCFVQMFCVLVVILVVAEITVGVLVYVYKQEIGDSIVNVYKSILDKSTNDEVAGVTLTLIHNTLHCCGVTAKNTCRFHESCPKRIKELINSKAPLVMGVFIGTGVLLFIALIASTTLSRKIRQSVSSPQYIILAQSTHTLAHPHPPQQQFVSTSYPDPDPDPDPVIFTPLPVANIPVAQP